MGIKQPKISVLTPVWNGLPYIKECVDSVLTQDFHDWEFIISDNGSTDGTRDYLDSLTDPRIKVYKQEKNLGIDGNLNFLFSKPSSDFAYCLCADDYLNPGALRRVMHEWETNDEDLAFIVFNWNDISIHAKGQYSHDVLPRILKPSISQLAFFLFGNLANNLSNISTRVSAVTETGGFDMAYKMAGDMEIWARIARKHSVLLSDFEAAYVRRHEGTATNYLNKQGRLLVEQTLIYEALIDRLSTTLDRQKLVDYFNIDICSYHYRESIRLLLLKGRIKYLWLYYTAPSKLFWPTWKRVFLTLPYAVNQKNRLNLLVKLADELITLNNKQVG
jgi:glycosyltransferase involved in cell wall biosynthesis